MGTVRRRSCCSAITSCRNNDARRINEPAKNAGVRKCPMRDGHDGVVIGIEIRGGCRNLCVESCKMDSPSLDHAMRFRSNARRVEIISVGHVAVRPATQGRFLNSPSLPACTP